MQRITPSKLKKGDTIRVISPSRSLSMINYRDVNTAEKRFRELGLKVTFSKNAKEVDEFVSSSIESRIDDLHDAFLDPKIKAIFTTIGGFNANQLLRYIDYDLIKAHPKILCGFSDITALGNAIYAKTGLMTYSGPHFATFGMVKGIKYTSDYLKKCMFSPGAIKIEPSLYWSNDPWFLDQVNRRFVHNEGYWIINEGDARGTSIGGNLCTFNLLQGTEFMPSLEDAILFIEDDAASNAVTFDRDLQSLIHQPGFEKVKALIIGRFERKTHLPKAMMHSIIRSKRELDRIPVIANADFGHTTPIFTFPIGGSVSLTMQANKAQISITSH